MTSPLDDHSFATILTSFPMTETQSAQTSDLQARTKGAMRQRGQAGEFALAPHLGAKCFARARPSAPPRVGANAWIAPAHSPNTSMQ